MKIKDALLDSSSLLMLYFCGFIDSPWSWQRWCRCLSSDHNMSSVVVTRDTKVFFGLFDTLSLSSVLNSLEQNYYAEDSALNSNQRQHISRPDGADCTSKLDPGPFATHARLSLHQGGQRLWPSILSVRNPRRLIPSQTEDHVVCCRSWFTD